MEKSEGVGDAWNEGVDSEAVGTYVYAATSFSEVLSYSIGLVIGEGELANRYAQANVAQVWQRREAMMCDLVDIKSKLGLDVLARALCVVDDATEFVSESRKFNRDGKVSSLGVADGVADVVRERADGEGQLVCVAGVAKEVDDEVPGADVMGEVGEGFVAEGIVTNVLNDAAGVGVGASLFEIGGGEVGIAAEQQRND